jgi:tRNA dimethylallyltransferase
MNKLIVISGPTATGKTRTSIALAKWLINDKKLNTEIVNFDSLLFYREISIGTAKPTKEEQNGIVHHMIDIESIQSPMNAADFVKMGETLIKKLFAENKIVILIGGSAFYLRALLKGMYESTPPSPELKNSLDEQYKNEGIKPFIDYLQKHDPDSLKTLHENDHYRLQRAVGHHVSTGDKMSGQKKLKDEQDPYDFSRPIHPWDVLHIYLDLPKDQHFEVIQNRTKQMFVDGFLDEIENLEKQGIDFSLKPLQSIGYKEAFDYKKGLFKNLEECIERISISTRQLAKAQRTFFNKIHPKESFNPLLDFDRIKARVQSFLD